jgi:hypothetical protein
LKNKAGTLSQRSPAFLFSEISAGRRGTGIPRAPPAGHILRRQRIVAGSQPRRLAAALSADLISPRFQPT